MIRFENLSMAYWVRGERKVVIDHLNVTLPTGQSLALLGRNEAGKSTLMQIAAGTLRPTTGRVISDGSVSWPVGFAGSFHGQLTGAENVRFIARIYGVDADELIDFVEDFAELGKHFYMPVRTYSSGMKSRLTFGASMGIRFDTYLVDEATAVGDAAFKAKSKQYFNDRVKNASALLVSHDMSQLRDFCEAGVILADGKLTYYDDIDEAIETHLELIRSQAY